ncbi:Serine/threonine protein kinase [Spraguea lophii 42_110]|uniref:non-specific serine/threonine protein kinase n=1 Tax=Spraguea lophii (strain 42_110) TaxID=1358809 RepID=S7W990_SPRLO|nr:Serine/threonine protein kinase [Spraguea lophii 42_110]
MNPMSDSITQEEYNEFSWLTNIYKLNDRCGYGTFSTVYKALDIKQTEANKYDVYVALKNITRTTAPNRVADELNFLGILDGKYNCSPLLNCFRYEDQVVAVFPYFEYTEFKEFLEVCTEEDIRCYLYNILLAVDHMHKNNIIHRDIKPSNFLYNKSDETGMLIDFGLAQFDNSKDVKNDRTNKKPSVMFFNSVISRQTQPPGYLIGDSRPQMKAPRGGTRGFRAPEVLFRLQNQCTKIDIWSVGVILLILLSKQFPFFNSMDDKDSLVEIAAIFGQNCMRKVSRHFNRSWKSNISTIPVDRIPFERLVSTFNKEQKFSDDVYDLLYKMMELYPEKRISADEALKHRFFRKFK